MCFTQPPNVKADGQLDLIGRCLSNFSIRREWIYEREVGSEGVEKCLFVNMSVQSRVVKQTFTYL